LPATDEVLESYGLILRSETLFFFHPLLPKNFRETGTTPPLLTEGLDGHSPLLSSYFCGLCTVLPRGSLCVSSHHQQSTFHIFFSFVLLQKLPPPSPFLSPVARRPRDCWKRPSALHLFYRHGSLFDFFEFIFFPFFFVGMVSLSPPLR